MNIFPGVHAVSLDDFQDGLPIAREFRLAYAGNGGKFGKRLRTPCGHVCERPIMEDDVGRQVLSSCQFEAFGAQPVEQGTARGGNRFGWLPASRLVLKLRPLRNTQAQRWLLTQKLAPFCRDGHAPMARYVHVDQSKGDELADN